jgi:AraC-like DNA-binding protein
MRLQVHHIISSLRPFIKMICSMDCDEDADTRHIRVLPDSCVELFVNYTSTPVAIIGNELHSKSIVTFRMSKAMDVQMRKGSGCIAICFHPGTAYHFFGFPMYMLSDTTTAFSDLWKHVAAELEEKLASAPDNDSRAQIVQKHLLKQLSDYKPDQHLAYCLKQAHLSAGSITVSDLCSGTGLSQRHLSRKFQHRVGLSPKEYLRICRFIRSLEYLKAQPELSLTRLAYQSGYYDQAHFNRDYKAYAGCTPREIKHARDILY